MAFFAVVYQLDTYLMGDSSYFFHLSGPLIHLSYFYWCNIQCDHPVNLLLNQMNFGPMIFLKYIF